VRRAFSVAVYARRENRVLVIHHRRLETWLPLGGELEAGETPLEAARRELREESGLEGSSRRSPAPPTVSRRASSATRSTSRAPRACT
jgi:8-oxo-dGTP pyrophosphatase MutT (NUDIX family)